MQTRYQRWAESKRPFGIFVVFYRLFNHSKLTKTIFDLASGPLIGVLDQSGD
jgi:hypothetical protein